MIGKTISHYKILEKLGEGGMGVVYKARDLKLDRFVAIKFLPHYFSNDEERKKRFIHEAKIASGLDHPNISTIYDFERTTNGELFFVMAYYEGLSLKEKLEQGSLSTETAIDIVTQIATGLTSAHGAGIYHRDIKPANIIITKRGEVKIVDFGLAQSSEASRITKDGLTPGTVAYMSPEQLMGDSVNSRTDIWSLGVVLYEMLSGVPPFRGDHDQAVIYSILKKNPVPVTKDRPDMPQRLSHIISKCLAKKPLNRYQNVDNVLDDLTFFQQKELQLIRQKIIPNIFKIKFKLTNIFRKVLYASTLVVMSIITYLLFSFFRAHTEPPMTEIPLTSLNGLEYTPSFSPDGNQIAYYWKKNDFTAPKIYVKTLATGKTQQLTNQPGSDRFPVWTPDGKNIAFVRNESIYIISALGVGTEKLIVPHSSYGGINWSPDGKWLAFTERDSSDNVIISLLSTKSGDKKVIISKQFKNKWEVDLWPVFSPDSKKIAFYRRLGFERGDIFTVTIKNSEIQQITFDDQDIQGLTWASNGKEIVFSSKRSGESRLWCIPAKGGTPRILAAGLNAHFPTISSDGKRLAYADIRIEQNIYRLKILDSLGQKVVPEKIVASSRIEDLFQISPDGKRIAFNSTRSGSYQTWICDSDGQNPVQLTNLSDGSYTPCWSPDGKWIAFSSKPNHNYDIFVVSRNGGIPKRITTNPSHDIFPQWSRDGNWLYFSSDRSGKHQIWKISVSSGTTKQMTSDGARRGFESMDGKWFYYLQNGKIEKIPVSGGDKVQVLDDDIEGSTWGIRKQGIYYFNCLPDGTDLKFLDFAKNSINTIASVKLDGSCFNPQISPDGKWLYFTCEEPWQADIKLVENWR